MLLRILVGHGSSEFQVDLIVSRLPLVGETVELPDRRNCTITSIELLDHNATGIDAFATATLSR